MNHPPIVSICCITYNHELYIREAVDSFLMQETNFKFEIVIGDDCSTDRTSDILREYSELYPDKIRLLDNSKNLGSEINFVRTIKACKGKYIATCDGDDYWTDKRKIQKLVNYLEHNPNYVFISHSYKILKNNTILSQMDNVHFSKEKQISINSYCSPYIIHTSSILFHKSGIDFNTIKKIKCFKDISLFGLLLTRGNGYYIPDEMAIYRLHSTSIWTSVSYEQKIKSNYESLYYLERLFRNKYIGFSEFTWNTLRGYLNLIKNNRTKKVERLVLKIRILQLFSSRLTLKNKLLLIFKSSI